MMYAMTAGELGTRIRRARERKRWKQQDLADALGVSLRTVGSWERGEAIPKSSLGALEAVLDVSFSDDGAPEAEYDPGDPAERAIWEDPLVPSIETRRFLIGQLRAARQESSERARKRPA